MLQEFIISYGRTSLYSMQAKRHSIYVYYIHAFMSNTSYNLRDVLKYKNFCIYAVILFLCSVKNTILNTILRIEFWIVCIVGFCLVFSCFYHCNACDVLLYQKCLILYERALLLYVCMYFNFVVHNEIRLLLLCTIVAIKASIGVYGYNSSFMLPCEYFVLDSKTFCVYLKLPIAKKIYRFTTSKHVLVFEKNKKYFQYIMNRYSTWNQLKSIWFKLIIQWRYHYYFNNFKLNILHGLWNRCIVNIIIIIIIWMQCYSYSYSKGQIANQQS